MSKQAGEQTRHQTRGTKQRNRVVPSNAGLERLSRVETLQHTAGNRAVARLLSKDFERMELNTDWIDKHLTGTTPSQLTGVMFYQIEAAQPRPEVRSN